MVVTLPTDPNVSTLTSQGLTVETIPELVSYLTTCFQTIYGPDVNLNSNSPDGQLINIFSQVIGDFLELLTATYNLAAVPTAYGTRLDQLVALNGLVRKQGTYTQANVNVTFTSAVTIYGLNQTAVPAFTVADTAGNQYQLVTSYSAGSAGTQTLVFQAVTIGQVQTIVNTITNIITSTLGVSTVNNPSIASDIIGVNEESDAALKIRHSQSFAIASTGPSDAMEAALHNISDVVDALVVENNTGGTVNGIPANSIWTIVNGGTPAEIGAAIYSKKAPGCGMKGGQNIIVTRPNGAGFTAYWDVALSQPLYIAFSILWIGAQTIANSDIQTQLAAALVYKLGQNPTIADFIKAMQIIAPTAVVEIGVNQGVSANNSSWGSIVNPTTSQYYFTVSAANISV